MSGSYKERLRYDQKIFRNMTYRCLVWPGKIYKESEREVPPTKGVSDHIFVKTKANALTSEEFSEFIEKNGINGFFIAGADATACVKSTCYNMTKGGYAVHVISDCVTSYDLKKLDEMYAYYANKGCEVKELKDYMEGS